MTTRHHKPQGKKKTNNLMSHFIIFFETVFAEERKNLQKIMNICFLIF